MADFENKGITSWWDRYTLVKGAMEYAVSPTVTNQQLREQLEQEATRKNRNWSGIKAHEWRHADISRYVYTIKEPKLSWKIFFLDEVSADLGSLVLFREDMLNEYVKQLEMWKQEGKDPKDFSFSVIDYALSGLSTGRTNLTMVHWWDANNDFAGLLSGVSQSEAAKLVSCCYDLYLEVFNPSVNPSHYYGTYSLFGVPLTIPTGFDTEEFFQKAVSGLFTIEIGDKNVNLLEVAGMTARQEFLSRLNAKMKQEYERWLNAVSVTGVTVSPTTMTLRVGEYGDIKATLQPENSDFKLPRTHWQSSDNKVVPTPSGNVTYLDGTISVLAIAPGTATITAETLDGGFTATCVVTVTQ
jgi:hypothetical protein